MPSSGQALIGLISVMLDMCCVALVCNVSLVLTSTPV